MMLTGEDYRAMALYAFRALDGRKEEINQMNVFPVPDGDTGTNMSLTLSTLDEIPSGLSLGECTAAVARHTLFAARGNSGAILSLFLKGVSKALSGKQSCDARAFAEALAFGAEEAYRAVETPKEGTVLTVMRAAAVAAKTASRQNEGISLAELLSKAADSAEESLRKTPELLPVLKEAGVLDAGGFGFVVCLYGMLAYAKGEPLSVHEEALRMPTADFSDFGAGDIAFAYCTECVVEKNGEYKGKETKSTLCAFLSSVGDSVVFAEDESIFKLHVHTSEPGEVLSCVLKLGALLSVKIENMRRQHTALAEEGKGRALEGKSKKHGFLCVCSGEGVRSLFYNLGADEVVDGGTTMNPDARSIADAANKIDAETVFILPNSKNVFLVAERAREILGGRAVVLPTETVAEGIAAMLAAQTNECPDTEKTVSLMKEACACVTSMAVSRAVRDSRAGRFDIKRGEYIGLVQNTVACMGKNRLACAKELIRGMAGAGFVTLLYGEGVSPEEAQSLAKDIRERLGEGCEVTVIDGGQPVYDYILSVE